MCSTAAIVDNPAENQADKIESLIQEGEFTAATHLLSNFVEKGDLSESERSHYRFEIERLDRVRKDFTASRVEVLDFIREIYPEVSDEDMARWEEARSLEWMIIDGGKVYFARAARNLFRIDPEMKQLWAKKHAGEEVTSGSGAKLELDVHNASIIEAAIQTNQQYVEPRRIAIKQQVVVKADEVPAGELVRCWIPYPRPIPGRQENLTLLGSTPERHILAPADALQRTIYMEKKAVAGEKTSFSVEYELTAHGVFKAIDPDRVSKLINKDELQPFLSESGPHIVFTPELRELSTKIVGDEENPYRIAQLLFAWVDGNTPWASAREYSSIRCIPEYAYLNGHGDCGIQTLLFITLCRINGIPARWQSGWELQPPDDSMHDWGMIYFEPYGWVPMDVTYGLRQSDDPRLKWFYLSGMDSYRIIFNDDISQPFTPVKTHFRSETVDSQRGEVEWSGGNLYFDQWRWYFDWEIIEQP